MDFFGAPLAIEVVEKPFRFDVLGQILRGLLAGPDKKRSSLAGRGLDDPRPEMNGPPEVKAEQPHLHWRSLLLDLGRGRLTVPPLAKRLRKWWQAEQRPNNAEVELEEVGA
jgi:hypothetical protein